MKIEQIKSEGTFYKEGDARDRMWKCTEWIEEFAIPKLRSVGLLKLKEAESGDGQ
jgi:hypothetical protein